MPVCYKNINNNFALGLWEITENETELLNKFSNIAPESEIEQAVAFKYPGRRNEWIATRLLLYDLLSRVVTIDYDLAGKPLLENQEQSISISHTKGMVAVVIGANIAGIDIELYSDRVLKIEKKFMSGIESSQVSKSEKAKELLIYWSAKETLFKLHGGGGLDFKKNLYINPFKIQKTGIINGEIILNSIRSSYLLNYFNYTSPGTKKNYLVVYYSN